MPDMMAGYFFFLENVDPHLESPKTEGELGQDLHGAGEQEGELVLTQEMIQTEREEEEASGHQDAFEEEEDEEEAMESEPAALDKDSLCPREEDTIQMQRSPGCKTCRYLLVRTPKTFRKAQVSDRALLWSAWGRTQTFSFLFI
jgi:hypothetical protein